MPMDYEVSARDYRILLMQMNSVDVIIRQLKELTNWRPDDNSHPLSSDGPRDNIVEAVKALQKVQKTYRDDETLCRPRTGFFDRPMIPGLDADDPTAEACNVANRNIQLAVRQELERLCRATEPTEFYSPPTP